MLNEPEFVKCAEIRKRYGVSVCTIRNWEKSGKIKALKLESGRYLYNLKDVKEYLGHKNTERPSNIILYCRVSSSKQREDLERQKKLLQEKYPEAQTISDIASGLNFKRKGFTSLLEQILQGNVTKIVCTYKDRLLRFGFDMFKTICDSKHVKIEFTEQKFNSDTEEITADLLSIFTFFTARTHGKRKGKNKNFENEIEKKSNKAIEVLDGDL